MKYEWLAANHQSQFAMGVAFAVVALMQPLAYGQEVKISVNEPQRTVAFVGPITLKASEKLVEIIKKYSPSILRITSTGGDIEAGMRIGESLHTKEIDIAISGPCLSACANYIFTAARKKVIEQGGYVGWHGNATHLKYLYDNKLQSYTPAQYLLASRLAERENAFFESVGVNGFVCWFGKLAPFSSQNYYILSKEVMEAFGIFNVSLPNNYLDVGRREELTMFTVIQQISQDETHQPR